MIFHLFFLVLFTNSLANQNRNDVCTILSICDNIDVIRSEVAAVRKEQERQANILERSSQSKTDPNVPSDFNSLASTNNNELCTILTICDSLAEINAELAAIRVEQERQADLLEESCQSDSVSYPANCYEALKEFHTSGVIEIRVPEYSKTPFKVACDQESHDGGWTIILRRTDGSEDFYRDWKDYKEGFGQVDNEYFVGLDILHKMTYSENQELLVLMEDFEGNNLYQRYLYFKVGGEATNYTLETVGMNSGTAGDALLYHSGMQFSTKDRKNDRNESSCAISFKGAWWYRRCYSSNLAGRYHDERFLGQLYWLAGTYNSPLKTAVMMIRPFS